MRMKTLVGVTVGLAIAIAACGDDGATTTPTDSVVVTTVATTEPESTDEVIAEATDEATDDPIDASGEGSSEETTVDASGDAADGTDTFRVVSLSSIATEMIYAIGAEDVLVAVDEFSYYPEAALDLPHDLSAYEPNVEAIAAYDPDLVLIGGDFTGLGDQLASIGIESWDGPTAVTLDDTYAQIEQLGEITGHEADAADLVDRMQSDIDAIVAAVPPVAEPLTYYHELGNDLYSVTSSTFIGQIYGLVGLVSIADAADPDGYGYPQLNAEFIVESDPDLIFLADTKCCGQTADTVAARPGWDRITAVEQGNVIELDDDIASRWGPRVVDFLQVVADAVAAEVAAT